MESEQTTTTRGKRRGNRKEKTKDEEIVIGIDLDFTPPFKADYHSVTNLKEAYESTDLNKYTFFLNVTNSELHAVLDEKFLKASLSIFDKESNKIESFSLDSTQTSSLSLWNATAFLYFDKTMAERFQFAGKNFRDCLMYADLRAAFDEKSATRGYVIFAPVVKNPDGIMRRAVIADDVGVYLLGGVKITNQKKNPLSYTNSCSYYEIDAIEEIGTKPSEGTMDSMESKRDDLIVCQNKDRLFVTGRSNWNPEKCVLSDEMVIEVFEKEEFAWTTKFTVKYDPDMLSYSTLAILGKAKEDLMLLIGYRRGKPSPCYMIDMNKAGGKEEAGAVGKNDKIQDSAGNSLVLTGFETFYLQNSYNVPNVIKLRNYKKDIPETEEFLI